MDGISRRHLLRAGVAGLGVLGGGGALLLSEEAAPTDSTDDLHDYITTIKELSPSHGTTLETEQAVTERQVLGPYYRKGAPFRAKVTPPFEPGRVLVVRGRVWGHDTKAPLAGVLLDVWQANADGHYDMSHPDYPLEEGVFLYRARMLTDESGYYEFETVYPGRYGIGTTYRPAHIHYWVRHPGYRELVTQLYFEGDPYNGKERGFKDSLVCAVHEHRRGEQKFETCSFDIVLASAE